MQNNPKTKLHMHADPQMRIRLQLFRSIVTIIILLTTTSLRSPCNVFHIQMQSMRRFHFGWSFTTTRNASNEEKKKNQDNCSWPSWRGILQSCKTKAASSEEWMNDTMDWSKSRYFNRWRAYFSEIYPVRVTLKFLDIQKKNDFELLRKFLLLEDGKTLWTNVGKKVSLF